MSHHTFSFNNYYDSQNMGWSDLRVINEDFVKPAAGFGTHSHKDMEIITWWEPSASAGGAALQRCGKSLALSSAL